MTEESTKEIHKYCDDYGDKLLELMDICGVYNLQDVPEEMAINFIRKLKGE